MCGSLFGFGMGIILASFHVCGMLFVLSAVLYMCVSSVSAEFPKCLRCFMFMLSGPVELLFLELTIACLVSSSVMFMCVLLKCFIYLSMSLFCLCVL